MSFIFYLWTLKKFIFIYEFRVFIKKFKTKFMCKKFQQKTKLMCNINQSLCLPRNWVHHGLFSVRLLLLFKFTPSIFHPRFLDFYLHRLMNYTCYTIYIAKLYWTRVYSTDLLGFKYKNIIGVQLLAQWLAPLVLTTWVGVWIPPTAF